MASARHLQGFDVVPMTFVANVKFKEHLFALDAPLVVCCRCLWPVLTVFSLDPRVCDSQRPSGKAPQEEGRALQLAAEAAGAFFLLLLLFAIVVVVVSGVILALSPF